MQQSAKAYAIGIDFGTESGRAVLVDTWDGTELATAVHVYGDGVITDSLPGSAERLPPDWALQNPQDYIEVFRTTVPAVLRKAGVPASSICGIGVDFTACTILPTLSDGTPLCQLDDFRDQPHAWVKLWKHHAAQTQADRINALARSRKEPWLALYGGKISSEWFFPKAFQILEEAPHVYAGAARLIEAADWVVWQLTGNESRNICTAGYKAIYQKGSFPTSEFFGALHPDLGDIVETRMSGDILELGECAGGLCAQAANWTGLPEGTPVAVANVDAHVTVPATGDTSPGTFVAIMGTSTCHVLIGEALHEVEGMCGVVNGGILRGLPGYEAGQSAVGDIFGWLVKNLVPEHIAAKAREQGVDLHTWLATEAALQAPGEHGLLALDWMNGNRSVLVDADLSGVIMGLTLQSTAIDVYRALLEATVFATRMILEGFEKSGVPVNRFVAAGGLPAKNPLLMQLTADICNRDIHIIRSTQGPAVGSAIHAAVAAGVWPDVPMAAHQMGGLSPQVYHPNPDAVRVYDEIYADYQHLHDLLGRAGPNGSDQLLKRLRRRKNITFLKRDMHLPEASE
ncbi:MAG: ribulokinase [Roseinatronobacter sp.]